MHAGHQLASVRLQLASVRHQSARNGERCVYWSWYCEPDVKDRRALCANVIWIVNMCLLYNKYLQLNNSRLLYILPPSFHPYTHHPFHHWCRCGLKSPVNDLPIRPWVTQQEINEAQQMKYYHFKNGLKQEQRQHLQQRKRKFWFQSLSTTRQKTSNVMFIFRNAEFSKSMPTPDDIE